MRILSSFSKITRCCSCNETRMTGVMPRFAFLLEKRNWMMYIENGSYGILSGSMMVAGMPL